MAKRSSWAKLIVLVSIHSFLAAAASERGQDTQSASGMPDVLWHFDAGGAISARPIVSGDLLFIASDSGKIFALKKETGEEVWTYDFHSDGTTVFRGSPLVYGNVVIVGTTEQNCKASQRGHIYGLEERTGKLRWKVTVPGVGTNFVKMGNTAIFGTGQDEWASIELRSGKLNWTFRAPLSDHQCHENSLPATDGVNIVVVAHDHSLYGLDAAGHKAWEKQSNASVSTNPFVYKDVAYFGTTNKHLYGLNPATGDSLVDLTLSAIPVGGFVWGGERGDESEYSFGLVESNGSKRNTLMAFSDEFERVLWSHDSDAERKCETPYYWHNLVLAGDCSGQIRAYGASDGRIQWTVAVNGCVRVLAGDRSALFVGVEQGTLYSLGYHP